jgi:predicted rRNA methylase YqxC with S4 and FtsJ domains
MESVLSEIDEAAEPGTKLSVLAKPQFAAKLKKQVSILLSVVLSRLFIIVTLLS